jgi:hypothetical protein
MASFGGAEFSGGTVNFRSPLGCPEAWYAAGPGVL